jgi:hypothetical protein
MFSPLTRRRFLTTTAQAGTLAGLGNFGFLDGLPPLSAAAAKHSPKWVRLHADIEPLVRLIEDTPHSKVLDNIADEVRKGTSYQQLLSAVFLAGVRGIQPRPVGYKFHAVLVINSAHLASLAATDRDRWLPLFWSVDNFKSSQARNAKEGNWHMGPVAEGKLPSAAKARKRFTEAMDAWDEEGADAAVTSLARNAGAGEIFELFCRYGARDFRDIGHKAIYVANGFRTLGAVGWRHAEPFLRSLAYALLDHRGSGNPAKGNDIADVPGRVNAKRARELAGKGRGGKHSAEAGRDLLATLRTASANDASLKVAELLKKGIHPDSLWDGLFLSAGELLMRAPGIVGLHCVTSTNALHYAHQKSASDETRRYLLLQNAVFLALFREELKRRDELGKGAVDKLEKAEVKAEGAKAIAEIFTDISEDRTLAARKTLALLEKEPARVQPLMAAARRLVFAKGRDSHDYKFSSAALEDYYHLSPAWRARFAATTMFYLHGSEDPDNDLIRRTRAALAKR